MLLAQPDQMMPGAVRPGTAGHVECNRNGGGPFQSGIVSELNGADKVHTLRDGISPLRLSREWRRRYDSVITIPPGLAR